METAQRVPTWRVPALAAAAVVVMIGTATMLGRGDGFGGGPVPPSPSTLFRDVLVPWADLQPTDPEIATHVAPARPDPDLAAEARPCGPDDVWTSGQVGAALGITVLALQFHGSTEPCHLVGSPSIELWNDGQRLDISSSPGPEGGEYDGAVLVAPDGGGLAALDIAWPSAWCTAPVRNDEVRIRVGDGWVSSNGFRGSPGCNAAPGSGPNELQVGTFRPTEFLPERRSSAYADVKGSIREVTSLLPATFEVVLTAIVEDVSLDPCPDYSIGSESYALNCEEVPYVDDAGSPYLPEGLPVRFEMRVPIELEPTTTWRLRAPGGPSFLVLQD